MSVKITFCRGFLEHLDSTLTDETFQVGSLDYYLHIERNRRPEMVSHRFRAIFVKDVQKFNCIF